ncbi:D-3-phosphoglycerate dehydrogenase [Nymphaea thermarum]|nr:D-3-phosphoglycerate dehydrogenase [Nymphaea thermarum]
MAHDDGGHVTRVLFCGPHFPASHNYTIDYLKGYPYVQVDVVPLDKVADVIENYHLCIVKNKRLDSGLIAHAKQMKLIMQYGVGLEGVDVEAATRHGIKVARIPGNVTGNSVSCAEHAIYLMLGLLRRQKEMESAVQQMLLGLPVGETLFGKTVLILGYGNIGVDLASLDKKGVLENLYQFAGDADIVAVCMALNDKTVGIVDKEFLSSMKKGAILVNVARGGLLDYEAIKSSLESGHLGGLGIDVAWTEPFDPDDPILKHPNVLITPHIAGVTEYSYRSMAKVVGDCALQLHAGTALTGIEFVN